MSYVLKYYYFALLLKIFRNITKEVEEIAPKISNEIQQTYQKELQAIDNKIEEHNATLINMTNKATTSIEQLKEISSKSLDSLITKSQKIDRGYFKQLGLTIAVTAMISAIVGASASYFMVQ
ncbi:MAG: hypothetical protein RCG15_00700 [Candidatus Rickettsia vulgarisii]